jgi:DeoR/GlpR family transcriptional regulator of sugar metabolism
VLSAELCNQMRVSEDTIRRDLLDLSEAGQLIKVHGGALSPAFSEVHFSNGNIYSEHLKKHIAQKAISLIKNGMFVLTGGGTTVLEMARSLPTQLNATFITGSIATMNVYATYPNIETIVIGGKISKDSKITVGADAISRIQDINADLCFLGANAIHNKYGITDNDWDVVQIKKAMIAASKKTVFMTISEKLETRKPFKVCDMTIIDYLITELDPTDKLLNPFVDAGINVL